MAAAKYPWKDRFGDFALVPIPTGERRSMMSCFLIFTGVLACIAAIMGGGTLGTMFNFRDLILVSVVGCAILAVIGGLTAGIGANSGCSTYVNMRFPYGRIGSWIFGTIIAGISCGIGWFAVQTWFFGIFVNAIVPKIFLSEIWVAAIWGGFFMILTAVIGYRGLAILSYLTVPMFMLLAGIGFMVAIGESAGGFSGLLKIAPSNPAPFVAGVTAVVGMYIAGATITQDMTRYTARARDGAIAWIVQVMVLMPYLLVGAGSMVLATGEANIAAAMVAIGLGVGAFLLVFFGQWTTNDNNLYSGALSVNTYIPIKKWVLTAALGIIGIGLAVYWGRTAAAGMQPFIDFITTLGKVLPPIAGGLIADFYIYRWYKGLKFPERYKVKPGMEIPELNWAGIVAVVLGVLIGGYWITWGIPALNSFLLAFAVYLVLAIPCDKAGVPLTIGKHILPETGI